MFGVTVNMIDLSLARFGVDTIQKNISKRTNSYPGIGEKSALCLFCVLHCTSAHAESSWLSILMHRYAEFHAAYTMLTVIMTVAVSLAPMWLVYYVVATRKKLNSTLQKTQQIAQQLKLSTDQLSYMVATSPTILFALNVKGNSMTTHWISDNLTRITGYQLHEAMEPMWWRRHLYKPDRKRVLNESRSLYLDRHLVYEYRFVHKNGSIIWIRDEQQLICDDNGRPVQVLAAWTEITERKLEEMDLRIAATAFEVNEGILITDKKGRILRVNSAFTRLTGYGMDEAIGQYPNMLKSGRQGKAFYRKVWLELRARQHWEGEVWDRHKNGKPYPVWLSITAVPDDSGAVSHYVAAFFDISELKEAEEHIRNLAFYDPLTLLPNRRLMLDRLGIALVTSQRSRKHGALMMMDLDRFKILNDTQGHDLGDQLLIEVAKRLQSCVREGDTVARMGGDEFVVMLENLSKQQNEAAVQMQVVADKIRDALGGTYWLNLGNNKAANKTQFEHHSSASIGLVLFVGQDVSSKDLLKRADMAMYQAKQAGRDTIRVFDPAMQSVLNERNALENDLRQALNRNQLALSFQRQVDATGQVTGAEAFLQWRHPERGSVLPAKFIALAEETGLILPIGNWVLMQSCKTLAAWAGNPLTRNLILSVNISARQFRQPDFIEHVKKGLRDYAVDPKLLKLEITENLVMENPEATIAKMLEIKQLGVEFAMDDFGTGYSSLAYLSVLPVEQLKIDKELIRNFASNSQDAIIIRSILSLGQSLDLLVIAEGVETREQWQFLSRYGCPAFQGYLFGRPQPIAEFEAHLPRISLQMH